MEKKVDAEKFGDEGGSVERISKIISDRNTGMARKTKKVQVISGREKGLKNSSPKHTTRVWTHLH